MRGAQHRLAPVPAGRAAEAAPINDVDNTFIQRQSFTLYYFHFLVLRPFVRNSIKLLWTLLS